MALRALLRAATSDNAVPQVIYRLSYEQSGTTKPSFTSSGNTGAFSSIPLDLAFNDATLAPVEEAWKFIVGQTEEEYMVFDDREGVADEDDRFD